MMMLVRRYTLIFCGSAIAVSTLQSAPAAPPGWERVWSDEFDGTAVDTTNWRNLTWTNPHNNEQQAYVPAQATVANGLLTITATNQPFGGKQYRSARLESNYANQYGRWEIRAKLPSTKGTWPAIWLLPNVDQYPWPTQGEIDIMENRGSQPNLTSAAFHFDPPGGNNHEYRFSENSVSRFGQLVNYHDSFHTYAVEWDANKLRFFIDDVNWYTLHDADATGDISQNAPMETVLNLAVGGDFLGGAQPDGSSVWPQQMIVDYVRVYERAANPSPVVFKNGSFEAQEGSLASWSTFGNNVGAVNVQVNNQALDDGIAALKLYGQFIGTENYSGIEQGISVSPGDNISASLSSFIRGADSIAGTNNRVDVKFDYYSAFGGKYDSSTYIGSKTITVANGSSANNVWLDSVLTDVVPAGAVEARLAIVFAQPNNQGGAVYVDDVEFVNLDLEPNADANGDGQVDGRDFLQWQQGLGRDDGTSVADGDFNYDGVVDSEDLAVWESQYADDQEEPVAGLVPEPASTVLTGAALLGLFNRNWLLSLLRTSAE